jgi:hypothetical protein
MHTIMCVCQRPEGDGCDLVKFVFTKIESVLRLSNLPLSAASLASVEKKNLSNVNSNEAKMQKLPYSNLGR